MSLLARWLANPPPDAAVEIAPERVSAAAVWTRGGLRGTALAVQAHSVESLPPGALTPALSAHNISDRAAVAAALRTVIGRLGTRPARVALVVPDLVAKVSLVRFDQVPDRREDLDQLVRWQMRKSAPFPVDDACITYTAGLRDPAGGAEFVVAMSRRDVIEEYEKVCAAAGVYAGLVDLATFSVVNLFLASGSAPAADWLLVHMRPDYTSIAIVRGEHLIFFRNRPEGDEEPLADLVHQTTMYYQDRLAGQGFARVLIGGSGRIAGSVDAARRSLEERLGVPVEAVDPTRFAALNDRLTVTPDMMNILAPLAGILMRTHHEAVTA
jgi:Tfp pilus assembly PilM family ATPase